MSQGYGQDSEQQGQQGQQGQDPWGQGGQHPSAAPSPAVPAQPSPPFGASPQAGPLPGTPPHGSSPQWAPVVSPSAHGTPGTPAGASSSRVRTLTTWMLIAVIAVIAVRVLLGIVMFGVGFATGASSDYESMRTMLTVSRVLSVLGLIVNIIVSLALLVLAVLVIVQARGRGRTGAIIVVAALVASVILYWILRLGLMGIVAGTDGTASIRGVVVIHEVLQVLRSLLVYAALIVGALISRRWAARNA